MRTSSQQVLCFILHLFSVESLVLATPFSSFMSHSNSPTTVTQFARLDDNDDDAMEQKSALFETSNDGDNNQESSSSSFAMNTVRNHILQVAVRTGQLCSLAMTWKGDNANDKDDAAVSLLADFVVDLHTTASALDLNLIVAMQAKLQLNAKKYPVELCKVSENECMNWQPKMNRYASFLG